MPLVPITHFTWQVLRAKRSKRPPTGKQLRLVPNRLSKDGTFFDSLVAQELLQVVGVDELPATASGKERAKPVQFRTRYKLTAKREYAAEYGEYQREIVRSTV